MAVLAVAKVPSIGKVRRTRLPDHFVIRKTASGYELVKVDRNTPPGRVLGVYAVDLDVDENNNMGRLTATMLPQSMLEGAQYKERVAREIKAKNAGLDREVADLSASLVEVLKFNRRLTFKAACEAVAKKLAVEAKARAAEAEKAGFVPEEVKLRTWESIRSLMKRHNKVNEIWSLTGR